VKRPAVRPSTVEPSAGATPGGSLARTVVRAHALMLIPMALFGAVALYGLIEEAASYQSVVSHVSREAIVSGALRGELHTAEGSAATAVVTGSPEAQAQFARLTSVIDERFGELIVLGGNDARIADEARAAWQDARVEAERVLATDPDPSGPYPLMTFHQSMQRAADRLDELAAAGELTIAGELDRLADQRTRLVVAVSALLVAGLIAGALLTRRIRNTVVEPIARLQEATERLAGADLTARVDLGNDGARDDEIGRLALRFNTMAETIETTITRLERLAHTDDLTGLANRNSLIPDVARRLGSRTPERTLGLLFVDIDHFKVLCDQLGHDFGDAALIELAERLSALDRASLVARLGGDDFVIVYDEDGGDGGDVFDLFAFADEVLHVVRQPITLDAERWRLTASVGIALADDVSTVTELVREVETAMYHAKREGRDRYHTLFRATPAVEAPESAANAPS
jgi:diguanylate cyclase (GGDEF)-like protein